MCITKIAEYMYSNVNVHSFIIIVNIHKILSINFITRSYRYEVLMCTHVHVQYMDIYLYVNVLSLIFHTVQHIKKRTYSLPKVLC